MPIHVYKYKAETVYSCQFLCILMCLCLYCSSADEGGSASRILELEGVSQMEVSVVATSLHYIIIQCTIPILCWMPQCSYVGYDVTFSGTNQIMPCI